MPKPDNRLSPNDAPSQYAIEVAEAIAAEIDRWFGATEIFRSDDPFDPVD